MKVQRLKISRILWYMALPQNILPSYFLLWSGSLQWIYTVAVDSLFCLWLLITRIYHIKYIELSIFHAVDRLLALPNIIYIIICLLYRWYYLIMEQFYRCSILNDILWISVLNNRHGLRKMYQKLKQKPNQTKTKESKQNHNKIEQINKYSNKGFWKYTFTLSRSTSSDFIHY